MKRIVVVLLGIVLVGLLNACTLQSGGEAEGQNIGERGPSVTEGLLGVPEGVPTETLVPTVPEEGSEVEASEPSIPIEQLELSDQDGQPEKPEQGGQTGQQEQAANNPHLAEFWLKKYCAEQTVIQTLEQITESNERNFAIEATGLVRLDKQEVYSVEEIKDLIQQYSIPSRKYLGNRSMTQADKDKLLAARNLEGAGAGLAYGVLVENADLRSFPSAERLTSEPEGRYDYLQETKLLLSEVVLVLHESRDGGWLFVQAENYCGWVKRTAVALCDREQFLSIYQGVSAGSVRIEEQPKAEPEAQPKAEPEAQPKAEPEAEPKAEPEAQTKAEPEAQTETESKLAMLRKAAAAIVTRNGWYQLGGKDFYLRMGTKLLCYEADKTAAGSRADAQDKTGIPGESGTQDRAGVAGGTEAGVLAGTGAQELILYLPKRDASGWLVLEPVVINHPDICRGYLPFTQSNLVELAARLPGTPYSWGDESTEGMDCSSTLSAVFRCFGFAMPRNTGAQQRMAGDFVTLSGLSNADRKSLIVRQKPGALLYMSGHVMLYLGEQNGVPYILHNTTTAKRKDGGYDEYYSCCITTLDIGVEGKTLLDRLVSLNGSIVNP